MNTWAQSPDYELLVLMDFPWNPGSWVEDKGPNSFLQDILSLPYSQSIILPKRRAGERYQWAYIGRVVGLIYKIWGKRITKIQSLDYTFYDSDGLSLFSRQVIINNSDSHSPHRFSVVAC